MEMIAKRQEGPAGMIEKGGFDAPKGLGWFREFGAADVQDGGRGCRGVTAQVYYR
jgi:hypothetical protein